MKRKKDRIAAKKSAYKASQLIGTDLKNNELLNKIQVHKATTHKGRKALQAREPQVHEDSKENMDPFRDTQPFEYLVKKNDCSLFCYGSSSKQRPFRLIMGRTFEQVLLDMYEIHISDYVPLNDFRKRRQPVLGSKPLVIAQGSEFESSELMKSMRNYLLDFFSTGKPSRILLSGIDQVITLTAISDSPVPGQVTTSGPKIIFRRYFVEQRRIAGQSTQGLVLEEIGPRFTLTLDRHQLADRELWKTAIRLPKEIKATKVKNVTTDLFGEKHGRIHLGVQDFKKLHTPHHHGAASMTPRTSASLNSCTLAPV